MIQHLDLGPMYFGQLRKLAHLIHNEEITLGGHQPGKVYGRLDCRAGKRMKAKNRVFFRDETKALEHGYRPCAVCMPMAYQAWKQGRA